MREIRPIKILFCIDKLARGGTELQLINLINRLDRKRYEPHLFTLRDFDFTAFAVNCPHMAMEIPRLASPQGIKSTFRLSRWIRKQRFDVVQGFFQDATIVGGLAARLAGTPIRIASFRDMGFWRSKDLHGLMKFTYGMMTGFIANSDVVMKSFVEEFGLDPEKFSVIYNGVDVEALPWVDQAGPTRHVGIVGNLNRRVKRTDVFINAAGLLSSEFPDITWHILGEGELRPEYEALAAKRGLGDRMVFAGSVDDVPGYLEKIQIAVIASDSEGLSNALLEYLFKGCATVATSVGGNPELVRDRETGLLVPPDDPVKMAEALKELFQRDDLRRELARNARSFADKNFSWDKCIAAHERLYRSSRPDTTTG